MTERRLSRRELRLIREEERRMSESKMASTVPSQGVPLSSSEPLDYEDNPAKLEDLTTQRASILPGTPRISGAINESEISDLRAMPPDLGGRETTSSTTQTQPLSQDQSLDTAAKRAQAEQRLAEARAKLEALRAREQQRESARNVDRHPDAHRADKQLASATMVSAKTVKDAQADTLPAVDQTDSDPPSGKKKIQRDKADEYTGVKPRKRRRRFDVISWFGEVLVTVGVILGLFAFWQVVVTDMQVADLTHNALVSFYDEVDCPSSISKDKRTENPPVMSSPTGGGTFAALHIPRWDYASLPIRETTVKAVLDAGAAGHYDDTVMPGDIGNFSIAAHRGGFGSSFKRIEELKDGDAVVIETKEAWYVYKMYAKEIVLPSENRVILPVPNEPQTEPKERLMTMTTCHPMYGNSERFIVHLKFDYWTPHSAGVPAELAQGGNYECM